MNNLALQSDRFLSGLLWHSMLRVALNTPLNSLKYLFTNQCCMYVLTFGLVAHYATG